MSLAELKEQYPNIARWCGGWIRQLQQMPHSEYRVLLDELAGEESRESLAILDAQLGEASEACANFGDLLAEKSNLPPKVREANSTILDKLAEVRAVCGLHRMGFTGIEFVGTPDLRVRRDGTAYLVDVTRLGPSSGKRGDVWESKLDLNGLLGTGATIGTMKLGGRVSDALSEGVYREIEGKARQLKAGLERSQDQEALGLVWISLGRDYLTAGAYELSGVGASSRMRHTLSRAMREAFDSIKETGAYDSIGHVVISPGRDNEDLVYPPLS